MYCLKPLHFFIELSTGYVYSCYSGGTWQVTMKIDMDKLLSLAIDKLQIGAESLSKTLRRLLVIILILVVVIASLYLIKNETTRTWGIIIFILSFAYLYSYVVRRRGTRK